MTGNRMIEKLYTPKEIYRLVNDTYKFLNHHELSYSEKLFAYYCLNMFLQFVNINTKEFYKECFGDE